MTEENDRVQYPDREIYLRIYAILAAWSNRHGEPIPAESHAKDADIEALVNAPRQRFFGITAYPSLSEKAAIIFYTVNKRHIFLNGNKRMSTLCMLVFLGLNDMTLDAAPDELTAKALWLAKSESLDFPEIKAELVRWIEDHLQPEDQARD